MIPRLAWAVAVAQVGVPFGVDPYGNDLMPMRHWPRVVETLIREAAAAVAHTQRGQDLIRAAQYNCELRAMYLRRHGRDPEDPERTGSEVGASADWVVSFRQRRIRDLRAWRTRETPGTEPGPGVYYTPGMGEHESPQDRCMSPAEFAALLVRGFLLGHVAAWRANFPGQGTPTANALIAHLASTTRHTDSRAEAQHMARNQRSYRQ